jgi:hypothetical protein
MVRLQMTKQLTMGIEGSAIDYVVFGEEAPTAAKPATGATAGTVVIAAALPGDRAGWYESVAEAAGARIERLGLSSEGVAALLAGASQRRTGPIMGVSAGARAVEFVVIEDGQLAFARSADVGTGDGDEAALVQRIAVEAKRTWMSYRVGEGSAEVDAVVVAGEGSLAAEIGRTCGEALEMQWEAARPPAAVHLPEDMAESARLMAAPLLGLLAEEALGRPCLDFAHPRKAPDLAAKRRQRVLAAAFGLIVVGGGAYVYSTIKLEALRGDVKAATEHGAKLQGEYAAFLRDHAQLSHLQEWTGARVDWIGHLKWLTEQMPDPRQAVMDQISGRMSAEVTQTPREEWYDKTGWQLRQQAQFAIEGRTKQADIARSLRDRLQTPRVYDSVETKGADTADQFSFTLLTARARPEPGKEPEKKSAKGGGQ